MAKKVGARQGKTLVCTVCNEENYRTDKNVKTTTDRLTLNKYCPKCRKWVQTAAVRGRRRLHERSFSQCPRCPEKEPI